MKTREKIETLRRLHAAAQDQPVSVQIYPQSGKAAIHTSVKSFEAWTMTEKALPALLDVAEKALAWCEWAQRGAPCDIPPGECRACELVEAAARLGEGE